MKPNFDNDDQFMAQFSNRLALEPAPQWTLRKKTFPWLEIGWAFAAALLLAIYWTELRFGFFSLHAVVNHILSDIPARKLFVFIAAGLSIAAWLGPKVAREL